MGYIVKRFEKISNDSGPMASHTDPFADKARVYPGIGINAYHIRSGIIPAQAVEYDLQGILAVRDDEAGEQGTRVQAFTPGGDNKDSLDVHGSGLREAAPGDEAAAVMAVEDETDTGPFFMEKFQDQSWVVEKAGEKEVIEFFQKPAGFNRSLAIRKQGHYYIPNRS